MSKGLKRKVAKGTKCRANTLSTSTPIRPLSPAQSRKKFLPVYLYPKHYLKLRRLADHHGLSLCHTLGLLVDAGCVGTGLEES